MGDPIRHHSRRKRRRSFIDPTTGSSTRRRRARFERLEDRRMLDAAPQLVLDIGQAGGGSQPKSLVAIGNSTYFFATDNVHGTELWRTTVSRMRWFRRRACG